jgi:hypothetical protein
VHGSANDGLDLDERAKERKITQLRDYFWALETYTLFEDSLTKTVEAWEHFKSTSLDKVNDGRNAEDYEKSVELIEESVDRLRGRIQWIRRKSDQVRRLREGLGFAAQMSDTSVTIGQNKNIRILTYFNILFLPLSLSAVSDPLPFALSGSCGFLLTEYDRACSARSSSREAHGSLSRLSRV